MTILLIRHTDAGDRSAWGEADETRPLSPAGERQAKALVRLLDGHRVGRVLSSPTDRCRQTVQPLADHARLVVEDTPDLMEGYGPGRALDLIDRLAAGGRTDDGRAVVLCTHGDVVPEVMRLLARRGVTIEGDGFEKGSTWILDSAGGQVVHARHVAPPPP